MADLDIQGMADLLGVPFTWVRDKVTARQIPHHRYGRHVRFTEEDIAEYRARTKEETNKTVSPARRLRVA